jgi:CheY-like chemotaxis protein
MENPSTPQIAVLIVEDDLLIRMVATVVFEDAGLTVFEAASADAAIRMLELHEEIRVVFTDITMPGSMDGLKLAHYVRERWPPLHIIVTSGKVIAANESLPAGALFVSKPYHLDEITSKVRELTTA